MAKRARGSSDTLKSGSIRVRVYAGYDPVTKRARYLTESVPAGPRQERMAADLKIKFLNEVAEQRAPKTGASLNVLLERYLPIRDVDVSTRRTNESYLRNHIRPYLGKLKLAKLLDVEPLDSFYAELRRCRKHCKRGTKMLDHRTDLAHDCDEHRVRACDPPRPDTCRRCRRMCKPHRCKPLSDSAILQIHWLISGALAKAVVWKWIPTNPAEHATKPSMTTPAPNAPTPDEAARLILGAYEEDVDWGEFLYAKATTGARRGEMCALAWSDFLDDEETGQVAIHIKHALFKDDDGVWKKKDTKTHQERVVVLDAETGLMLRERLARMKQRAADAGGKLQPDAYIWSLEPTGKAPLIPDSVTQRHGRLTKRLDIAVQLKNWRNFHATELIAAGLDMNVVAGRIGHGGGGATTWRNYVVLQGERAQRAAGPMVVRMPQRPGAADLRVEADTKTKVVPAAIEQDLQPYERIAADLLGGIRSGLTQPGDPLPTMKALAAIYNVAVSTAHRAIAILVDAGYVKASRGVRATVVANGQLADLRDDKVG
jgi:integrase